MDQVFFFGDLAEGLFIQLGLVDADTVDNDFTKLSVGTIQTNLVKVERNDRALDRAVAQVAER